MSLWTGWGMYITICSGQDKADFGESTDRQTMIDKKRRSVLNYSLKKQIFVQLYQYLLLKGLKVGEHFKQSNKIIQIGHQNTSSNV